jgi:hypothetical protein
MLKRLVFQQKYRFDRLSLKLNPFFNIIQFHKLEVEGFLLRNCGLVIPEGRGICQSSRKRKQKNIVKKRLRQRGLLTSG